MEAPTSGASPSLNFDSRMVILLAHALTTYQVTETMRSLTTSKSIAD